MKKLYEYNMSFDKEEEYTSTSRKHKLEHPGCWAGYGLRLMLMLLYAVSMLCLLRYDEALKMTWADIHFEDLPSGARYPFRIRLDLPFRKTHQHGGMPVYGLSTVLLTPMHRYCPILPLCRPFQALDVPCTAFCHVVCLKWWLKGWVYISEEVWQSFQ